MVVINAMEIAVDKLKKVGFSEYEAKAYIALLEENPLTAYEIAKNSGIPTSKIYEVIKKLEKKRTVQSIHGERSKMFIPQPPDEFIRNFRVEIDGKLHAVRNELKDVRTGMDTSYTWHIKDQEGLILKARRMLDTAGENILLAIWPDEIKLLDRSLEEAAARNVKIAMLHYGPTTLRIKQTYIHPVKETLFAEKGARGFVLVADSKEALNARITGRQTEAIWSKNGGFVVLTENYIRHEIYQMKTMKRFEPLLRKEFGERYERLLDIYNDE
ncbi:sugar-specific transcriptional regulator TrmB [bacterium BMS3Abin09]|nr:sugar-specific transcriptional regulator TrmB [bacterium BMS3Abin09]GBE40251.1 sugar-specific transcriptional regulator TrmB [bacterium BMS3Bbin09]HDH33830.1 TrmB family transcriptional regulator [Nitrospirota bacterium]HDN94605.1 TrmB family transcriptional regulator [Nitrospirota bacterium]HDO67378.1 TrmB family transcriptional regulator [Nitrospirota bacterium]